MRVFPLSFSDLSEALALTHGVAVERMTSFEARLKNLQRLGILPEINTGKGKRANYGVEETALFFVAVEMLQLGMSPERVSKLIGATRSVIVHELKRATGNRKTFSPKPGFMYFDPRALAELQDESMIEALFDEPKEVIRFGYGSDVERRMRLTTRSPARLAIIDLMKVVGDVTANISRGDEQRGRDTIADVIDWAFEK